MSAIGNEPSDFTTPTELSDVILKVEGKDLYFNKAYLATWSPVFRRMFFGEFKEKNADQLALPDKKFTEVQELLRCICPVPKVKAITGDHECRTYLRLKIYNYFKIHHQLF